VEFRPKKESDMHPDHQDYAKRMLSTFIYSAIQRLAHRGDFVYRFSLEENDIKEALGLSRGVKANVLADYVTFFQSKGVAATESFGAIDVVVNLNSVTLNPGQAEALGEALSELP
jgi:hypothetical protein